MRGIVRCAFAAALSGLLLASCSGTSGGSVLVPYASELTPSSSSVTKAYEFLRLMMDKYATGRTTRLVQSFDGGPLRNFTDAVTYDDALFIDALLADGTPSDVDRSKVIGDAFLYVQRYDESADGRLRAAYGPRPLESPRDIKVDDNTSDVGNMAWVGQALVQLYAKTKDDAYLKGALAIAKWMQRNVYDTRGSGGYTGGYTASGRKIEWKSTEHNIDVYALFRMLATESGDRRWTARAAWAERFVASMWDSKNGRFFVGTGNDGVTPNRAFKPEDVNSWSYLAFANPHWAAAPSWDVENLSVSRRGFSGVSFCSGDRSGVWFEGTAHLADALELRNASGDQAQARAYLADIVHAQAEGPNGDGLGIIAASKNGLSDCDGDKYFASLHVGATAWYVMAVANANPFSLL